VTCGVGGTAREDASLPSTTDRILFTTASKPSAVETLTRPARMGDTR
jgi:hypothetical protein